MLGAAHVKTKRVFMCERGEKGIVVGETVILLHPPLPVAGVSIGMERECQQNDSIANGYM